jgi:uncharacterized repeat protein (TIGR01451 family)
VGGYFGIQTTTPTFTSAALMCDNGSTTSSILVARDNGTAVFTIRVQNTGDVALVNVVVTDDLAPGCGRTGGVLAELLSMAPGDQNRWTNGTPVACSASLEAEDRRSHLMQYLLLGPILLKNALPIKAAL